MSSQVEFDVGLCQTVPASVGYWYRVGRNYWAPRFLHLSWYILKVIVGDTDRSATCYFLLLIHSNYFAQFTRWKARFRCKNANFPSAV